MADRDRPDDAVDRRRWLALIVELPAPHVDDFIGCLADRGQGAEVVEGSKSCTVKLVLRSPEATDELLERARALLRGWGLDPDRTPLAIEVVEDGRWVERYQAQLRPFALGQGFRIHPSGQVAPSTDGRLDISLIPGRAFGTGEHATTRMCAEELERAVTPGSRWADVGCGSAILSLVAASVGARSVLAIDVDHEALLVAREVLQDNAAGEHVRVCRATATALPEAAFDGVVCNISAPYFAAGARELARILAPGGTVIASGFTHEDAATVTRQLASQGLSLARSRRTDPWAVAVLTRAEANRVG